MTSLASLYSIIYDLGPSVPLEESFDEEFIEKILRSDKPYENILYVSGLPQDISVEELKYYIENGNELSHPLGKVSCILFGNTYVRQKNAYVVLDRWYDLADEYSHYYKKKVLNGEHFNMHFVGYNIADSVSKNKFNVSIIRIESLWLTDGTRGFRF